MSARRATAGSGRAYQADVHDPPTERITAHTPLQPVPRPAPAPPAPPLAFGALLRQYREAAGMSQRDLAQAAGITQARLCRWERGTYGRPDAVLVWRLAAGMRLGEEHFAMLMATDGRAPQPRVRGEAVQSRPAQLPIRRDLSPRQLAVLRLLAAGLGIKEIARRLDMAYETTRNHVLHIYQRLGAENGPHAVAIGYATGLLRGLPGEEDRP